MGITAAGVAVTEALSGLGIRSGLKWPNDILVQGRKLGGILSESRNTDRGLAVVIGLGLNVNETAEDFPPELRSTAVSIRMFSGKPLQREHLLAEILNHLEPLLSSSWLDPRAPSPSRMLRICAPRLRRCWAPCKRRS